MQTPKGFLRINVFRLSTFFECGERQCADELHVRVVASLAMQAAAGTLSRFLETFPSTPVANAEGMEEP